MQRELQKERTRCRALEDELKNPINIHHWRKMEATDPSTFELIQKIHCLQRRLIAKTQEVVEKELLLQEKEKLYVELKHILARQPGPEAAEKLQVYQRTLREKTKQLKALTAELNMHESQAEDYKYEIERLAHELQEVKKKYLAQKRKDQEYRFQKGAHELPLFGRYAPSMRTFAKPALIRDSLPDVTKVQTRRKTASA
ncbi:hypothetical protein PO909_015628 [Leuciscus waleckii]